MRFCPSCGCSIGYEKTVLFDNQQDNLIVPKRDDKTSVNMRNIIIVSACLVFAGFIYSILGNSIHSHNCVGEYHGTITRLNNSNIQEHWSISIRDNGECSGKEVGSGEVNYVNDYIYGAWKEISDDIIYVELSTDDRAYSSTYSNEEINQEAAKAQTPWAKSEAYKRTSGKKLRVSRQTTFLYLRSDGTVFRDGNISDVLMKLTKSN